MPSPLPIRSQASASSKYEALAKAIVKGWFKAKFPRAKMESGIRRLRAARKPLGDAVQAAFKKELHVRLNTIPGQ